MERQVVSPYYKYKERAAGDRNWKPILLQPEGSSAGLPSNRAPSSKASADNSHSGSLCKDCNERAARIKRYAIKKLRKEEARMKDALEAESYGAFPHYDEPPLKRARFYGPNLPMPVLTQATPILDKLEVVASITRPVSVDRELPSPQLALASPILNSPVVPPSMIRPEHPRDQQLAAAAALCALKSGDIPPSRRRSDTIHDDTIQRIAPSLTPPNSMVRSRSISSSPGPRTPLDLPNSFSSQQLKVLSHETPQMPTSGFHNEINQQQRKLFRDPRVTRQLDWFRRAKDSKPRTFYSVLAPVGIHILETGRPAQTSTNPLEADYLVGDCFQYEKWLLNGTGDKLFVIRDEAWFYTRPVLSGSTVLDKLKTVSRADLSIEVQLLEKKYVQDKVSVTYLPIADVKRRFADHSQTVAPINLLSLMGLEDGAVPWPLSKHCGLLNDAAAHSASTSKANFAATVGKQASEIMSRYVDLQSCIHFQIFGQAGAISAWHIDALGPYTHITLEPNVSGAPAEDVLKLWAYVRTDHLSLAEHDEVKREFIAKGGDYKPPPDLIRVIALVAGDTLVMPPGTIHSPITVTDCLFRGGMVMHQKYLKQSVEAWKFCNDNGNCTNESQPRQARSVLDYLRKLVHADPKACGYDEETIGEFDAAWKVISSDCMTCKCSGGCKDRCGCKKNSQRCGGSCHPKTAICNNPYGCEAELLNLEAEATLKLEAETKIEVESNLELLALGKVGGTPGVPGM